MAQSVAQHPLLRGGQHGVRLRHAGLPQQRTCQAAYESHGLTRALWPPRAEGLPTDAPQYLPDGTGIHVS
jgi:hypothetical protein